ncbi:MAG: hypothetical protein GXO25_05255 [Euryarchaeota archaeon]|nr:hypothetical protein [Euryarchaeota archaeon]
MHVEALLSEINDDKALLEEYSKIKKRARWVLYIFLLGGAYLPVPFWFMVNNSSSYYAYFIPLFILLTPFFLMTPRFSEKAIKMCWKGWFSDPSKNALREKTMIYLLLAVAVEDALFLLIIGLRTSTYIFVLMALLFPLLPVMMLKRQSYEIARYYEKDAKKLAQEVAESLKTSAKKSEMRNYRTYIIENAGLKIKITDHVRGKSTGVEISGIVENNASAAKNIAIKIEELAKQKL